MLSSLTWGMEEEEARSCGEALRHRSRHGDPVSRRQAQRSMRAARARASPNPLPSCSAVALTILRELSCEPCSDEWTTLSDAKSHFNEYVDRIQWGRWPRSVHPAGGDIPENRVERKREQIESLLVVAIRLLSSMAGLKHKLRVVEFCGGSGYVALPLAMLFPNLEVVVIDCKRESIARARERVLASGVSNLRVVEDDIRNYAETFDLGIALHACGSASDMVLEQCLKQRAAFLLCPCCIGKIMAYRTQPLSRRFAGLVNELQFRHLLRAADTHHDEQDVDEQDDSVCRSCKLMVEADRCHYAQERGYSIIRTSMPAWASPKRDIIAGLPIAKGSMPEEH